MGKRKFNISGIFIAVFALLLVTCEKEKDEESKADLLGCTIAYLAARMG